MVVYCAIGKRRALSAKIHTKSSELENKIVEISYPTKDRCRCKGYRDLSVLPPSAILTRELLGFGITKSPVLMILQCSTDNLFLKICLTSVTTST